MVTTPAIRTSELKRKKNLLLLVKADGTIMKILLFKNQITIIPNQKKINMT